MLIVTYLTWMALARPRPLLLPVASSSGLRGLMRPAPLLDKMGGFAVAGHTGSLKKMSGWLKRPTESDRDALLPVTKKARSMTSKEMRLREQFRLSPVDIQKGEMSLLESQAVGEPCADCYKSLMLRFENFCEENGFKADTDASLDMALLEFYDHLFMEEEPLDQGTKTLAAVGHHRPRFHRSSRTGLLPRARRALQGWQRIAPLPTRLPLPWIAVAGIAMVLAADGHPKAAVAVMVGADAYLRPGEIRGILPEDIVAGRGEVGKAYSFTSLLLNPEHRGVQTKTHQFDDSVIFDSKGREWIGEALMIASKSTLDGQPIFNYQAAKFNTLFRNAGAKIGLGQHDLVPYLLRHTGPSHDYLTKTRSLVDIKRRGRWRSDASVRRYEKSSRVMSQLGKLAAPQLAYMRKAEKNLFAVLCRGQTPLPPPPLH